MTLFAIILIVVWVVAVAAWWLLSNAFKNADADKIKNRLLGGTKNRAKKAAAGSSAPLIQPVSHRDHFVVLRVLHKYKLQARLQELIDQAGVKWDAARFMHVCMGSFLAGFVVSWYMLPSQWRQLSFVTGLGTGVLPLLYLLRLRSARLRKFEELFPDSLEFVARSMRAGHAFSVSLEMIHREFQEPLAGEFRRTFEEHNLGLPLDVALEKLAKRVPSLDVHFFVSAVLLQKRTGGNLAEILDKLAYVIRERFKLRGKIRAISAHGKMTGAALSIIPLAVAFIMFFTNPDYVKFFFTDDTGNLMMGAAIMFQLIGYAIIRKIVSIEV